MAILIICVYYAASHIVDPKIPGIADEIINLGDFWNESVLMKYRKEIIKTTAEIGRRFARAYRYLKAAKQIYDDSAALYEPAIDGAKMDLLAKELAIEIVDGIPVSDKEGWERRLFAGAITPDGLVNYLDELMATDNIYILEGFPGAGTEKLLEKLKCAVLERGFDVEAYYCAFNPDRLEHLIIPGLNTAFTTVNRYHSTDACALKKVNFEEMLDYRRLSSVKDELEYNYILFDSLLYKAVDIIHSAKELHDELETFYIPSMNFAEVEKRWETVMEKILDLR